MPIRTFLDADVLINAFRGVGDIAVRAQAIIDDPNRQFVASDILRLELIPKPHFNQRALEIQFYQDFFAAAVEFVETSPQLVQDAEVNARAYGLAAADALHITAAQVAKVDEFISAENATKPIFRVKNMTITSLRT
jgi:hypothetical protein